MEIPFDILDHIFSLLKSHPESLVACSKVHPTFSQIVKRHRYFHIIIHTGATKFTYSFEPSYLTKLLSETPRIVDYVRILQIEFHHHQPSDRIAHYLDEIASILPMFLGLECIMLTTLDCTLMWQNLSQRFKKAVEDCLRLPTLQEVHVGNMAFPLSMLDNHAHIKCFSLSGWPLYEIHGYPPISCPYPQLKSLSLQGFNNPFSSFCWAKQHIAKLQSLKYGYSNDQAILSLLEICSDTLNNLDLTLERYMSEDFETRYSSQTGRVIPHGSDISINLSSLPHLQHLTIRTSVYLDFNLGEGGYDENGEYCWPSYSSFLPAAVEILKTASSLQHLAVEIYLSESISFLDDINFSPLTALVESSASIHQMDLYIYSRSLITGTKIIPLLARYGGVMELIEQGVLVIHPDEPAPAFLDMCI